MGGTLILAIASGAALLLLAATLLRGWQGWLDLRRAQLFAAKAAESDTSPAARIALADLKARVRRLEAIADGAET